ncbi:MAG: phosphoribosylamine--glycine ligase [Candidatus Rokubacteria bacterium]|nr:phosphoribosylamine--glycine ligase [Candidatus Rokubacteria bacterium]
MRVLVIGSGGREHALVWALARSPHVSALYAAPGNPGMARHARCFPVKADDFDGLLALVRQERIDLTVVGPEQPLALGIVDAFQAQRHSIFGPTRAAAALEASKAFAKELMAKHGIPTARFQIFDDPVAAGAFCRELGPPLVVKADGLAAGKGALVCRSPEEADRAVGLCLVEKAFGRSGERIVVEEFLEGQEASFFALTDGERVLPLGAAQDHKAVFDDDRGPNTGGMGAYSPAPVLGGELQADVMKTIVIPAVKAMAAEGRPYRGVVYAGLMISPDGPKLLEFNCRFGDPEAQAVLPRLAEDLLPLLAAVARGEGLPTTVAWRPESAVCVVLASGGYPGDYQTGKPIAGIEEAQALPDVTVFHAGTAVKESAVVTAGGRVLGVTALGRDIPAAIERSYEAVGKIRFEGMHYRKDIGRKALSQLWRGGR